ncbi:hypothetical protein CC78DRAFT_573555 [Lojkania enalia]|uniref:Uncharacterized protein n=1 Tax=Lojkania enalia TaxID=147567 RepID=A0A9P4NDA9_9PLEO|nr:hypothetical protein CC78DRAFT_573555 [Didymosphaeria enalia]
MSRAIISRKSSRVELAGPTVDSPTIKALVDTLKESFVTASDLYRSLNASRPLRHSSVYYEQESSTDDGGRRVLRGRSRSRGRTDDDSVERKIDDFFELRKEVKKAFEDGYHTLGERFAGSGDPLAQNQLQTAIISMQQIIIATFRLTSSGREPDRHDVRYHSGKLYETAEHARDTATYTLKTLRTQLSAEGVIFPTAPTLTRKMSEVVLERRGRSRSRSRRRTHSSIFCLYAQDLQNDPLQPLADDYKPDGDGCCPFCRCHIPIKLGNAWEIVSEDTRSRRRDQDRVFVIGNRFVIKSHRDGGGFACVLCSKFREEDTVCRDVRSLVDHVWKEHSDKEIEVDEDIEEVMKERRDIYS